MDNEPYLDDELLDYMESLDEDIRTSLKHYTAGLYEEINQELRLDSAFTSDDIKNIDQAFEQAPELKEPLVVYRGVFLDENKVYEFDNAYVSTSLSEEMAKNFAEDDGVVLQITVSPGSKILYLEPLSDYSGEEEVLLDRGGTFYITGEDLVNDVKYMYLTYTRRKEG